MKKRNSEIRIGYQLGKLTVVADTGERKAGYVVWNCQCGCGRQIRLDTRALQRQTFRDCGCETKVKPGQKDLTGQRFGRLVAVEATEMRGQGGATIWRCRCDCGREAMVSSSQLLKGARKSCGCLSRPELVDLTGQRFGKLVVTGYAGKWSGMHRWNCQCDCGKDTVVGQTLLRSGKTKSCGCLKSTAVVENMRFVEGTSVALLESAGRRLVSSNNSGHNGVYFNSKNKKWIAQIGFKGKTYYLGSFQNLEEAVQVRKKAEERLYGEFLQWYYENHGKSQMQ